MVLLNAIYFPTEIVSSNGITKETYLRRILPVVKNHISMVSCQKDPTRHAYASQIGPFWQDTLDL